MGTKRRISKATYTPRLRNVTHTLRKVSLTQKVNVALNSLNMMNWIILCLMIQRMMVLECQQWHLQHSAKIGSATDWNYEYFCIPGNLS